MRKWPIPGEAPVTRARNMCLAYRATLKEREEAEKALREALDLLPRKLVEFDNPAILAAIDNAVKTLDGLGTAGELDERFHGWGEEFHYERVITYGMDDLVKSVDAGKLINLGPKAIAAYRIDGRIKGHWDPDIGTNGGYWYRVRDLYELKKKAPGRGHSWREEKPPDTLNDSRRGDGE